MNATNCFSISMKTGLVEGISLILRQPLPGTQVEMPHLRVGANFVRRGARAEGCNFTPMNGHGLVYCAALKTVFPERTKPFPVLSKPNDSDDNLILFVDCSMQSPPNVTIRPEVAELQLRSGISGSAEIVMSNAHQSLVNFTNDGQDLFIRYPTGEVLRIVRKDNRLWPVHLNPAEMAGVWVNYAEESLDSLPEGSESRCRHDGILFSAIKLLRLAKDKEARGIIVDFLSDMQDRDELTLDMKSTIRGYLERWNDLRRYTFDPHAQNIFVINTGSKRGVPIARQQQLKARSARDQHERNAAKGHAAGGKKAGGKKGH